MNKLERLNRVIARGEKSNNSHVIVGDATIERDAQGRILVNVGDEGAFLKHLLETEWMEGREAWTGEHTDIPLEKGQYEFIQQVEYDPYNEIIKVIKD